MDTAREHGALVEQCLAFEAPFPEAAGALVLLIGPAGDLLAQASQAQFAASRSSRS